MKEALSAAQLTALALAKPGEAVEFFILLGGGMVRSSKTIVAMGPDTFEIYSDIDDSEATLSAQEFADKYESIVRGVNPKGARIFWLWEDQ